jgi:hypothetical protein
MQDDRAIAFRMWAAECLDHAQYATDPSIHAALLMMAQNWMDLANGRSSAEHMAVLEDFNQNQMFG